MSMRATGLAPVLVALFAAGILVGPVTGEAQQARTSPRIGYLTPSPAGAQGVGFDQFRQALREIGYVDGQNILFEERSAGGELSRLPHLAAELVRMRVDVIVAVANEAIRAARDATATIPIVMRFSSDDPVTSGFVNSYARPGGNVTGLTILSPALAAKRLELLKEIIPGLERIAVLVHPKRASYQLRETQAAARSLGIQLHVVGAENRGEYRPAFATMIRERARAVYVTPDPVFFTHRKLLIDLAAENRLPAFYDWREYAEAGGLMSYGPNLIDLNRRAAHYLDRLLKGAKPGDLPIEDPNKFELVVNLKTARALGLTIPTSVLLRADEVIQ
jgi:putative ABC transport system substrate-binding protein